MRGVVFLVAAFAALTLACHAEPERVSARNTPGADERIQRLRDQLAAAHAVRDVWQPWFDRLRQINQRDYQDTRSGFFLSKLAERSLFETEPMAAFADPATIDDPQSPPGPLATLVDLKRQLDAQGIDLLVVPVPPKSTIFPEAVLHPLPSESPPLLDALLRELYLQLELHGVEVLDLLPMLVEQRFRQPRLAHPRGVTDFTEAVYRRQEMHWGPYGAELAAAAIAERVRQYPWFDDVVREFGQAELEVRTEWRHDHGGMVVAMMNRGEVPRDLPREWYPKRHVKIQGERWSDNDATSPIMLSGDSFSDPQYGLADQLLHELGLRVDLIFTPGGTARFDILRLRRERLAQKRLLIVEVFPNFGSRQAWRAIDLFAEPGS